MECRFLEPRFCQQGYELADLSPRRLPWEWLRPSFGPSVPFGRLSLAPPPSLELRKDLANATAPAIAAAAAAKTMPQKKPPSFLFIMSSPLTRFAAGAYCLILKTSQDESKFQRIRELPSIP
jgi:hypothetical protein